MALEKCVECGKEISTDAASCPGCGKPIPTKSGQDAAAWFFLIVFVLILVVGGAVAVWWSHQPQYTETSPGAHIRDTQRTY